MSMLKKKAKEKRKRRNRFKKFLERSPCRWCDTTRGGSGSKDSADAIDYKNVDLLTKLVTGQGKIYSRKRSSSCARHQQKLKRAIKQSRYMGLLPYSV